MLSYGKNNYKKQQEVDLLDSIVYLVRNTDTKKSFEYMEKAYDLAKKENYISGIAREGVHLKVWYYRFFTDIGKNIGEGDSNKNIISQQLYLF